VLNARTQPFFSEQVDAIVCGGTLKWFSEVRKVLYECKRVLKPDGRYFLMHLLEAETWWGKGLQITQKRWRPVELPNAKRRKSMIV